MDQASNHELRLKSWKRIAAHLQCSERTARRWERSEGLPVYRHHHEVRSTVFAFTNELDDWASSRQAPPRVETTGRGETGNDVPAPAHPEPAFTGSPRTATRRLATSITAAIGTVGAFLVALAQRTS